MLYFPNAKINIGLYITEKRGDGYHNLETIFYPVALQDVLEIVPSSTFKSTVLNAQSFEGENICSKAYHLLKTYHPNIQPITLNLLKNIPVGAGLGGGSSDAAFTLKALRSLNQLDISDEALAQMAKTLGVDCAFFIQNKPVFAHQKGDEFQEIQLDLSAYQIILAMPNVSISTAVAYQNVRPKKTEFDLKSLIQLPVEQWKNHIHNDFETSIFPQHPEIEHLKNELYHAGALYASMSGSGACVYGIFPKNTTINPPKNTQLFYC